MQKSLLVFFVLTLTFLLTATIYAVPPSDEVIQQLKDDGRFDKFLQTMAEAHAKGIDAGLNEFGKTPTREALAAPVSFNVLVILIDFSDKPYTAGAAAGTPAKFDSVLFSDNRVNPTGSMKEFYYENSYGNFILQGTVVGWYRAAQVANYYTNNCDGSHGMGPYPHNAQKLVEEAVALADPDVDYSQFDHDQ